MTKRYLKKIICKLSILASIICILGVAGGVDIGRVSINGQCVGSIVGVGLLAIGLKIGGILE